MLLVNHWQFFVSLTWASVGTKWKRRHQVKNWLRNWAARHGICESRLPYIIRWELGEIGDRPHCHLLVGGLPLTKDYVQECYRAEHFWKAGISDIRLFNPARAIGNAAYLSGMTGKKRKLSQQWASGANAYEIKKFGRVGEDSIYVSRQAWELMLQLTSGGESRSATAASLTVA